MKHIDKQEYIVLSLLIKINYHFSIEFLLNLKETHVKV